MALKRLETEEMIAVTHSWATPEHPDRTALALVPVLAALLPDVDEAHDELCDSYQYELTIERILTITHAQEHLNSRHSNVLRTIWYALLAHSCFTRSSQLADELRGLQSKLLPDGLDATEQSYAEKAREAEHMAERLTSQERGLLAQVSLTDDKTLLDAVDEWISLAAQLGALERERCRHIDELPEAQCSVLASRNQWIRTVRTIRTVAALVARNNQAVQKLMSNLDAVEHRADLRAMDQLEEPDQAPENFAFTAEVLAAIEAMAS